MTALKKKKSIDHHTNKRDDNCDNDSEEIGIPEVVEDCRSDGEDFVFCRLLSQIPHLWWP